MPTPTPRPTRCSPRSEIFPPRAIPRCSSRPRSCRLPPRPHPTRATLRAAVAAPLQITLVASVATRPSHRRDFAKPAFRMLIATPARDSASRRPSPASDDQQSSRAAQLPVSATETQDDAKTVPAGRCTDPRDLPMQTPTHIRCIWIHRAGHGNRASYAVCTYSTSLIFSLDQRRRVYTCFI